jgi:hypothetical protein
MLEESLTRLTEALDRLTAALIVPAQSKAEAVPELEQHPETPVDTKPKRTRRTQAQIAADQAALENPPPTEEPKAAPITLADLLKLAQALMDAGYPDKIREVNAKFGVPRIREIPEDKYPEVHALLGHMLANASPV